MGKDSNIPGWLTTLAGVAKGFDLETRQKMLPKLVGGLHESGLLSELVGEDLSQPAVYMAHFLGGSGEPLELNISDENWEELIWQANKNFKYNKPKMRGDEEPRVKIKNPWKKSTNPKYHADQGWEWKQINPMYRMSDKNLNKVMKKPDLYHILGSTTTLRRRRIDNGNFEYQIAEDFDVTEGMGQERGGRDYSLLPTGRDIPTGEVAKFVTSLFPEYTEYETGGWDEDKDELDQKLYERQSDSVISVGRNIYHQVNVGKQSLKGVPVPIKSSYIQSRKIEDRLIDNMNKMDRGIPGLR